ncbi:hypothetical protein PABG_11692 [Paracoccidioides brasiliensis Pb03]|uniref:Uncharacterized protein n=1 Tax=Paracoccidioides brasiliensis (strain Pb18) TaxID=502780 RepID=A0A0A0HV42_PARBD|nr:uncharacterized protein PADG_11298 [Paracoccidioides brasiliensis Pb18]KGM92477.1 hypothetical protein PADG_11298 [Paracoccidioides brasiliensis Pb18]KGY15387.1 hypothetical protein PABG_11692 [Paracoccidioides brasiliensis Pb03]ODH49359.1 hypothetical protein GX48_04570 [Paracoccidioides brasiliensis]
MCHTVYHETRPILNSAQKSLLGNRRGTKSELNMYVRLGSRLPFALAAEKQFGATERQPL